MKGFDIGLTLVGYDRSVRYIKNSIDGDNKDFHNLIEELKNGDPLAFDEIYNRCYRHIAFVCSKFCDNKEDTEEVVQDTFVIAFKKAGELRGDTLLAYLRRIAINECFRIRKKNSRQQEYVVHSDDLIEGYAELDDNFLPEESLQNKEDQTELLRIIKRLPKKQWEMIYLYYYLDFGTEEIAHLMDCSMNNVYKTLHTARKTIKSKLEDSDKKKFATGKALVPLTALLFMEEELFASAYTPTASPFTMASHTNAVAGAAAKSTKGYVIAACVLTTGFVATALYFTLLPAVEDYYAHKPYYPAYEMVTPALEYPKDPKYMAEDFMEEMKPPVAEEPKKLEPEVILEPEHTEEHEPEVIPEPTEEPEPEPILEPEPTEESEPEPEVIPEPEPIPEPPEEPVHVDRTAEILAQLAVANTAEELNRVIRYFGFTFADQMQSSAGMRFRFYVTDEGSGDILIGIAVGEDGSQWRI